MTEPTSPLAADVPPALPKISRGTVIAAALGSFIGRLLAAAIVIYVAAVLLLGWNPSFDQFLGAALLLSYASS